jgi:phosphoglycerate dehydrogenase-like enzyme
MSRVLVTFSPPPDVRQALVDVLEGVAELVHLPDLGQSARLEAPTSADAVLAWFLGRELNGQEEFEQLRSVGLVQLLSAGVDDVPFERIPQDVPLASNAGAYAQPMAEHVLALALALAKRLPGNHAAMARGEFDQQTPTLSVSGSIVGILGFGGIGQASATLFKGLGARIHAINRSTKASQLADWMGTLEDLDALLRAADILVVSLPLTRATRGLIGERELLLMKPSAILVNVARAAILDEDALYRHLRAKPSFSAGLDAWWQEPMTSGSFTTRRPFFELPNLLGSPHNSGITRGSLTSAACDAAENIARLLRGDRPRHLVDRSDYIDPGDLRAHRITGA